MNVPRNTDASEALRCRNVREALTALASNASEGNYSPDDLERLKKAILINGFYTSENQEAVEDVKFAQGDDYANSWGLSVSDPPVLLSNIVHIVAGEGVPAEVSRLYPQLTERQWYSAMGIIGHILSCHEVC